MAKKRVVAIDDSPMILASVKGLFKDSDDIDIQTADDATQGLKLIEQLDYQADLIILDYNMPDMSGIEMLRKLKSKRPDFPVPVIMLTTQFEMKSDEARRLGIVMWILKPFKEDKLKELVPQIFQHYPVRG